jgi:hypothetical protein
MCWLVSSSTKEEEEEEEEEADATRGPGSLTANCIIIAQILHFSLLFSGAVLQIHSE